MFDVKKCYYRNDAAFGLVGVRVDEINGDNLSGFVNWFELGYRYYFDVEIIESDKSDNLGDFFILTVPVDRGYVFFYERYQIKLSTFKRLCLKFKNATPN